MSTGEQTEPGYTVGARRNHDGTWDLSRAGRVVDTDGSWAKASVAAKKAKQEKRRQQFEIPSSVQPGTAQHLWYQLRNARMLQQERLEKDQNNLAATVLIDHLKLKQVLLQELSNRLLLELKQEAGHVDDREADRRTIAQANALIQEDILRNLISQWEDEIDGTPDARTFIDGRTYPLSTVLPLARDLSNQLLREAEDYLAK